MAKVIFLDIDGVLNSRKYMRSIGEAWDDPANQIDSEAVIRLNAIAAQTGSCIVLSSTWRYAFKNRLDKCQESMASYNILAPIIGMTPEPQLAENSTLYVAHDREFEIKAWLGMNEKPEAFVILDDEWMDELRAFHIKTLFEDGLQDHHVREAVRILNK
jgi:hypothetical protein